MGYFQPVLAFGLLTAHTFLGSFPAHYWPVPLVGQIRPVVRIGPFVAC
jgi:hypothetical protein